jgi:hypothetical protein
MARVKKSEIPPEVAEENEGLVPVTKDGEVLFVHPSCVEAHKSVDWLPVTE